MAKEEKKLGPGVTYHNLDGSAPVVTLAGSVRVEDGDTVDLIDELGETNGRALLNKLAGNPYFDVEGSDADHEDARETIAEAAGRDRRKAAPRKPAVKKAVARRIAQEDAEHGDDTGNAGDGDTPPEGELPPDVPTPDAPTLENNARPRLARARRGE